MIYVARHRNSPVNRCMNMYVQGCVHILHMRLMSHYQLRSESWNVVLGTAFHLFHTLKSKDFCVMAFFFLLNFPRYKAGRYLQKQSGRLVW